jgi:hypothetical protein
MRPMAKVAAVAVTAFAVSLGGTAAALPDAGGFVARCDESSRELTADWQRWSRENLPIAPDGVDFARIKALAAAQPATAERMLRLGLSLCDPIAAQAITVTKLRALLPELKALLDPANVGGGLVRAGAGGATNAAASAGSAKKVAAFRVDVVRAANAVDPATDYAPHLVPLLSDRDRNVRISAAMGARRFHRDGMTKALLETVRRDKEYLVRYHAAQSLLDLGDIYPRDIADHRRLFDAITGPLTGAPVAADFDRYALGARMLEKMMADRAAGKCSASVRPATIHGDVVRVGDRVVAVALDAAESSCAKEFAFVVFVEAGAAGQWAVSGVETTRDPTEVEVTTPTGPVVVEYSRAAGTARVRGVETTKGDNTIVLAIGRDGRVTPKWSGRLDTRIARTDDIVQALLQQSVALRHAVKP